MDIQHDPNVNSSRELEASSVQSRLSAIPTAPPSSKLWRVVGAVLILLVIAVALGGFLWFKNWVQAPSTQEEKAEAISKDLAKSDEILKDTREQNIDEYNYSVAAAAANMPELCEKISPRAVQQHGGNPKGLQVQYVRSDCYFELALTSKDPKFCSEVKSVSTPILDGSAVSTKGCKEAVASGATPVLRFLSDPDKFLKGLGYTDADVPENIRSAYSKDQSSLAWQEAFTKVFATSSVFKDRVKDLRAYTD